MSHQLAHRDRPLFFRERRHVGLNLVVELQPAAFQQAANRGRDECLRRRADPEQRLRSHGDLIFDVRPTRALGPDDLAIDADGHGQSGQVLLDQSRTDNLPCTRDRVRPCRHRRRARHSRHSVRIRVYRFCCRADEDEQPGNARDQQTDGADNE
jgi:hypothetical protein